MTTVFHVSDLHFGWPAVPEQIEAIEEIIQVGKFEVVAISGDLTQRARAGEFQRAAAFLRDVRKVSKVIAVPGNHDVAWWKSPLGLSDKSKVYANYRKFIDGNLEPVLHVPGATFVGINTAHGVTLRTLTWNLRDLSIIGDIHKKQLDEAKEIFEKSPSGDARVIVMHHNPVRGELSRRHGLKNTQKILGAFAEMGVDLVCSGHDHQESVHYIEHTRKGTVISTAGTISSRSRGGRPSSVNVIAIGRETIDVTTHVWSGEHGTFVKGPHKRFKRSEYVAA
jgi:3',5'-cyclic AMP phosphodiesterase CpdA